MKKLCWQWCDMKLTLEGEKCTGTNVTMEMYRTKHEFVVVTRGKKWKRKNIKGKRKGGREKRGNKKKEEKRDKQKRRKKEGKESIDFVIGQGVLFCYFVIDSVFSLVIKIIVI